MTRLAEMSPVSLANGSRDHARSVGPIPNAASSLPLVLSLPLLPSRSTFEIGSGVDPGIDIPHLHWRRLLRLHRGTFASSCRTNGRIPAPARRVCLPDFKIMEAPRAAVFHRRRRRFHRSRGLPPRRCSSSCIRMNPFDGRVRGGERKAEVDDGIPAIADRFEGERLDDGTAGDTVDGMGPDHVNEASIGVAPVDSADVEAACGDCLDGGVIDRVGRLGDEAERIAAVDGASGELRCEVEPSQEGLGGAKHGE